jgi:hypothetical protein
MLEPAARAMGLQLQFLKAGTSQEIDAALATFVRERPDALFVGGDSFFVSRRFQLVNLASRHAVPRHFQTATLLKLAGLSAMEPTRRMRIVKSASMPAAS